MTERKKAWIYCYAGAWEGIKEISRQEKLLRLFCRKRKLMIVGITKSTGRIKEIPVSFRGADYLVVTDFNRISKNSLELAEYINKANKAGTLVVECGI